MAVIPLDRDTKVRLTVISKPLNASADLDAMGSYVEELWAGSVTTEALEQLVERTGCIEQIERFAALVPGANVEHLKGIVAMIEVMDT